jgi:penicillin-binding protein 1C
MPFQIQRTTASGQNTKKPFRRFFLFFPLALLAIFQIVNLFFPLAHDRLQPTGSTVVLDRNGELLRAFLAPDEMWRIRVSAEEISPSLKEAVISYEDQYFYWHFGINPAAILRAAFANLSAGRVVLGGSTITMQVARLMQPKERTFGNKIIETFRALQLEWRYSKDEILTLYFNLAPYGGNMVGVGAASYFYFNKSADQLSLGEAALLAAIPNSPNLYRPDLNPKGAAAARQKILALLVEQEIVSDVRLEETSSEPLPQRRFDLPFLTPHLSEKLTQLHPKQERLETTIDANVQRLAQNLLQTHLQPLRSRGITNGAVVVIENKTQDVLAMIGSADFFDERNDGQVNGAMSPRSPGSALKPFIYALGFEHGLISPQSLLYDVPVEYGSFKPVNYDDKYHGAVAVEDALIRSLNVPAVNLYAQLGEQGIYGFLREAGVTTLPKPREYYGLSLILGGGEVTLLELTNLYAGLANRGTFRPYRLLTSHDQIEGRKLLTPGTCFILTEILSQLRRPELPAVWDASVSIPTVAWKTGTSYGHRDAWSIGYTPRYTIGVWVGNFDGKGVPGLVGAEVAAPILFALFNALEKPTTSNWFVQPADVESRQVCSISGMPLSIFCASTKDELYLPGISPSQMCTIHQLILVDKKSRERLCSHCRVGKKVTEKIVEQWPAEIATWLARNGYPVQQIPEHYSRCAKVATGEAPVIRSPLANAEYKIRPDVNLKFQKILLDASVSNRSKRIYWFLNGKLLFSGDPREKVFMKPQAGRHALMCVDDEGRSTEVQILIN